MQNTDFAFEFSEEATSQNSRLLQHHDYDLARALQQQQHSPLATGSEFKAVPILHHLCRGHPLWQRLQQYLSDGVDYSRATITDNVRLSNLTSAINRGNHKSASDHPEVLQRLVQDDVSRGFILPISVQCLCKLNNAEISPLGVVKQSTINETGSIIPKFRGTHDQSFPPAEGLSMNDRIDTAKLLHCNYGFTMRRLIHSIVTVRLQHPTSHIVISKVDLDKAYRRLHATPSLVASLGLAGMFSCWGH